jgi:hypothetical protein
MAAYNLAFDYRAIKATAKFFGLENNRDVKYILAKNMLDIWKLAKDTVCKEAGYAQYIDSCGDGYTAIGNMKTDAEHVYRYLVGDGNFHEAHTALADCRIEAYILNYILKHYKGIATYYIPKDDRRIRYLEIEGVDTGRFWYPPAGVERRITALDLFGISTFDPSQSPDKTVAITILKERSYSGTFTIAADFNVERVTTVLQEIAADHKEEDHAEEK